MEIQIIGTKKCRETQKAERYFKERRIKYQFRDLNEKGVSKGELENISRSIKIEDLIDIDGKRYKERNLKFILHNIEEELLTDPLLFKTPIVRYGKESTLGYNPEKWKTWH